MGLDRADLKDRKSGEADVMVTNKGCVRVERAQVRAERAAGVG